MLKDSIIYKGRIIEYEWTKTKRKTIGISIDEMGKITVKAPYGTTREQVMKCMENNITWLLLKLEEQKKKRVLAASGMEKREEDLYYLGKVYELRIVKDPSIKDANRARIKRFESRGEIIFYYNGPDWSKEERKSVLEQWYREEARHYLTVRSSYFAGRIGVTYDTIRIKNQKTRWGSCSSLGNINYNWRIMMAPPEVVDYLVVHELCHRKEMNHSQAFWKLVEQELPDYRRRKKWLADHSRMLSW